MYSVFWNISEGRSSPTMPAVLSTGCLLCITKCRYCGLHFTFYLDKVHKMLVQLLIIFPISFTLSCKSPPVPVEPGNSKIWYVLDGEPVFVTCPLVRPPESMKNNFEIIWYRNGSEMEISNDTQARVHQVNNILKFIPARLEDKDLYSCVYRNETGCWKATEELDVYQNANGSCYKYEALYDFRQELLPSITITCPYVTPYVNIDTAYFQWFKDCKPLDLTNKDKYIISNNELVIREAATEDKGKYTCKTSFIYNGTEYKISRDINLPIHESQAVRKPVILYPTNNFVDANLGASVTINCTVRYSKSMSVYWLYNDSFIDAYAEDNRVAEGNQYTTVTEDGQDIICTNLTFSIVKEDDYGKQFYCYVMSEVNARASITLKRPDPNLQTFLIAFFSTLVFIIIVAIIFIKVFKVDIVLWYRSSCFSHPQKNDGKTYDAYIMYPKKNTGISAYDMDLFVLKVLPEVLEQQCSYQLFIIGRDDLPGQAVAEVVDEAISQSRRLIIVLVNILKEDYGEDFEQKIAMYDALIQNKLKVIMIELEKIDYTNMPESIKYIKQKQGVVRWKQEFTEQTLSPNTRFWKNVRYRMPPLIYHSNNELHSISTEEKRH